MDAVIDLRFGIYDIVLVRPHIGVEFHLGIIADVAASVV